MSLHLDDRMTPNNLIGAPGSLHGHGPVPLSPTPVFDVPDSNPDDIAILWERVYRYRTVFTRGSKIISRQRERASKRLGEADSTASGIILNSCGIYICKKGPIVPNAFVHFNTEKPQNGYSHLQGLAGANVWVEKDSANLRRIAAEYKQMNSLRLAEEEFATYAKEIFLLRPWRSDDGVSFDRQWRADRMIELVCPPDEEKDWFAPPLLDGHGAGDVRWSWDVRPDCAYWLTLRGFNPEYSFQVQDCTFVRDYITCPYFTIEFKRNGQPENVALNRVAAAGSLALFNLWRLHSDARRAKPTLPEDVSGIRHYALTLAGSSFICWVLQPTIRDGRWDGCTMTRLVRADCVDEHGVAALIDWINEIHRWGLSEHGPRCERDVKSILDAGGVRTSEHS